MAHAEWIHMAWKLSLLLGLSSVVKWRLWSSGRRTVIGDTSVSLFTSCSLHERSS
ncbi:hypothetical protein HanRHA438_Chr13g0609301 [Helianthus annuus]|nr:hypothetical protein HanRHA438_Chr13g0609301 [Helianthus annuus]